MTKKIIILFLAIFLINTVYAATIHGTIYDLSLDKVQNAMVSVSSQPRQHFVAKNGTYEFNLPVGEYTIKAEYYRDDILIAYVTENISVIDDGEYVLDLILFPSFIDEEELLNEEIEIDEEEFKKGSSWLWYVIGLVFVLLVMLLYFFNRHKKVLEDTDLEKIIEVIKANGGRTTQKEVRKQIPLSEAKISLMITELEHKGKIKKIKKGRGNIIILNK